MSTQRIANIGIVTVSDRASRGEYVDRGGPAISITCGRCSCRSTGRCCG